MPWSDHDPTAWRELNHAWWEDRSAHHIDSDLYGDGSSGLVDFEWREIGSVAGLDVVHPQCHIGTDTLALAEGGARVVGLDFSANATAAAARLAAEAGLADRAEWVTADVYDSVAALDGRTFDLVYTGQGALCWLPDMDRWAAVMWALCRPGGRLYVSEFHPIADAMELESTAFERDYFPIGGQVFDDGSGSYADPDAVTVDNVVVDFIHPLSEVVQALIDAGFELRRFREFPVTVFERWPFLEQREPGVWSMPDGIPALPLMYSLLLRRPA